MKQKKKKKEAKPHGPAVKMTEEFASLYELVQVYALTAAMMRFYGSDDEHKAL